MKIFSVALNIHDHNTYDGTFHNQRERYTRKKHNIPWHVDSYPSNPDSQKMNPEDTTFSIDFFNEYFKPKDHELLAFTMTKGGLKSIGEDSVSDEIKEWRPNTLWDYYQRDNLYYIDHHQSHATYAYLTSGYKESDILAIDGRGWHYNCVFFDKDQNMIDLSDQLGIGILWNSISKKLGFGYLGAGKVMGLAAYGKYNYKVHACIDEYFNNGLDLNNKLIKDIFEDSWNADIAYTLQYATEERITEIVYPLKTCNNLCIAGGVAYNGYVNEMFLSHYKNVHVPPAAGDEGQSLGTYMHADYILNNNIHIPDTYAGEEYEYTGTEKVNIKEVAQAIADGAIIGWYQGKSESGNRALGNRSILADPRNPEIKDIINFTIKKREDFRPFAPSVLENYYKEYFDTNSPSPYMSRIVKVKSDQIPGVTHIDNTARIQTVNRKQNLKFYKLIHEFYKITGVPMLLNTSFNCQEPIVETPEQAIDTFENTDLDILVINDWILRK